MANQQTPCDELFDDDGNGICEGQEVRVNGSHIGKVHIDGEGKFHIDGWPHDQIIESLEILDDVKATD